MTHAIPHAVPDRRVREVAWLAAALAAWCTAWVLLAPLAVDRRNKARAALV